MIYLPDEIINIIVEFCDIDTKRGWVLPKKLCITPLLHPLKIKEHSSFSCVEIPINQSNDDVVKFYIKCGSDNGENVVITTCRGTFIVLESWVKHDDGFWVRPYQDSYL